MRTGTSIPLFSPRSALALLALALATWAVCLVPTGMRPRELLVFSAPGALLWIGLSAAAHGVARRDIAWRSVLRWLVLGAVLLPPPIGVLVALSGLERPRQIVAVFTLAAWLTLIIGAAIGASVALFSSER